MGKLLLVALVLAAACDDTAPSASADLAVRVEDGGVDLQLPTCAAGGPAPTCLGQPCAAGCKCLTQMTIEIDDAGNSSPGPAVGACTCSAPTADDLPWLCCGGLYCIANDGVPRTCTASNDCRFQ